jgi:rhamnosyltransferase
MDISVVIPTYNADSYLPRLLTSLQEQTVNFELIIIDSSSTDQTLTIAKEYTEKIITIPKETFDHGGTRTIAAKHASGKIVIFLTQDALPYDAYSLEKIIEVFNDVKVGAAYGRQIPYEKTSLFGKHLRLFNYTERSYKRTLEDKSKYGIKTAFLSDSFAAYRKEALQEIGWFKNGLIVGEDNYAGAKMLLAGHALDYCAKAKVYHSHTYSLTEEFKRYFDIGVFHQTENWIRQTFGKAEGEGKKYILSEWHYLLQHHAYLLIPQFFLRNGMKYLGYKLGNYFQKLPITLVKKLSLHRQWWDKYYD